MTDGALEAVEAALDDLLGSGLPDASPLIHISRWPVDYDAYSYRLRCDPVFAAEMKVCTQYGIPHSVFLRWGDVDRAKALAYVAHEARRCPDCGVHPDDWPLGAELPPYEPQAEECPACAELDRFRRWAKDRSEGNEQFMDGIKVRLKRRAVN